MARNIPARDLKADISSGFLSKRRVRNASGVTIAAGDVVVVVGVFDGLYLSVAPADADSASTLEGTLFVADAEIQNDAFGDVLAWKLLTGVNTAGASLNDPVYVSSTAGSWSLSGAGSSRRIGSVLAVDATEGVVLLSPGDEVPSEARIGAVAGGGTLGTLTDVDTSGANDNDVLAYDLGTNSWAPGSPVPVILAAHDTTTAATATGTDSLALGAGASATDIQTTAIGEGAVAGGQQNTAIGYNANTGTDRFNTAVGTGTVAIGRASTLVGYAANQRTPGSPDHRYAVVLGSNAASNSNGVSGQGEGSLAVGYAAFTVGAGDYRSCFGPNAQVQGDRSLALGFAPNLARNNSIRLKADGLYYTNNLCAYSTRIHSLTHIVQLYASTTDATPTEATSTGLAVDTGNTVTRNVVLLDNDKVGTFHLRMQGLQGTTNDAASYIVTGAVKCIAGTASIIGTTTTTAYEDDATWDCTVTTTSNRLVVTVTADAGGTTTWNGTLTLVYDG